MQKANCKHDTYLVIVAESGDDERGYNLFVCDCGLLVLYFWSDGEHFESVLSASQVQNVLEIMDAVQSYERVPHKARIKA